MSLAEDIARALGNGKEEKNRDGWVSLCPTHGDKTPSLSIRDNDEGSVDVFCHSGCNFKAVKDTLRDMGLLPALVPEKKNGSKTNADKKNGNKTAAHTSQSGIGANIGQPVSDSTSPLPSSPDSNDAQTVPPAASEGETPALCGTILELKPSYIWKKAAKETGPIKKYLANRAITIDPLPLCLKWSAYDDKKTGDKVTMIVAAASQPTDTDVYAVQRLFIDTDDYTKTGAKMHGPCDGRGVWFDRKASRAVLAIGEGIETVLSVVQATGKNGIAALSTSGMKGLIIPDETETIFILVDSDPVRDKAAASMPGQRAAYELAKRFTDDKPGRKAFMVSPDDTCFSAAPAKLDFNDLLKADPTGESIRARMDAKTEFRDLQWIPPVDGGVGCDVDNKYPPETIESLNKMNKKFAAVLIGGDFRVAKEGYDHSEKKHTLSFLKVTSLYSYYANAMVPVPVGPKGDIEYRMLAKVWMAWEGRRTYDDVVFDPTGKEQPGVYNLFRGFPLTPKQGDWSLMRKHIFEVICDSNAEHFAYVLAWMARAVQDPGGDKPGVAIVLKGGKGIGKGVFANYFGAIFGEAFMPIADSGKFTGRFNMHLSKSLVVFLDEAVWGGDKKAEGSLKQLITEPSILFEPKGIDSITLGNFLNVIIASNEDWVVPATGDERRFCVLQPSEEFKQDTGYFGKIAKEKKNGGAEAMMFDLLRHDYGDIDLRKAPLTEGLSEQVQASLPTVLDFWHSVLGRGYLLSDPYTGIPQKTDAGWDVADADQSWPVVAFKYEVYAEYQRWCKAKNERFQKDEIRFWRDTWPIWVGGKPDMKQRKSGKDGRQFYVIVIPELKMARAKFTSHTKIKFDGVDCENPMERKEYAGQF